MDEFKPLLGKLATGYVMTRDESAWAFDQITSGNVTASQAGAMLMALRMRGETIDEIIGAVTTLRAKMLTVEAPPNAVDVVGTGGDGSGSYNISTCAAFIVAGAGVPVAKHGNRALSSRCGAADVLGALGVAINLTPAAVSRCVAEAGIGFMFAPAHHPALKHVAPTRVEIGTRTIFNLLGPLLNPAGVRRHMVGVFSRQWIEPIAEAFHELGSHRAYVVYGADGLDEITISGPTSVASLEDGVVRVFDLSPADVGLSIVPSDQLKGGTAEINADALRAVLQGGDGPYRDVAMFNAAAALVVSGVVDDLNDGMMMAAKSIDSGEAKDRLDQLVSVSNTCLADPQNPDRSTS